MKKSKTIAIIIASVIIVTAICVFAFGEDFSFSSEAGKFLGNFINSEAKDTVATFNGTPITQAEIEYTRNNLSQNATNNNNYDKDIDVVNKIIIDKILVSEAEKLGISATSAEVAEMFADQKKNYEDHPPLAEAVDEYCNEAGITLEEYWVRLEEHLPRTISRQKMRNQFDKEYCEKNGIEYGEYTYEEYMKITEFYDDYCNGLLEQYKDDIVYNIE